MKGSALDVNIKILFHRSDRFLETPLDRQNYVLNFERKVLKIGNYLKRGSKLF